MAKSEKHDTLPAPDASGKTLLIVRAPYYKSIADNLLDGARGAIEAAGAKHELIDVPGALSITGFDDLPLAAHLNPPLTTIAVPASEMGARAANALAEALPNLPLQYTP